MLFLLDQLNYYLDRGAKITREQRKLHNERYHNFIIFNTDYRVIRWVGHVGRIGEKCIQNFNLKS
jgi:hypothetical protein